MKLRRILGGGLSAVLLLAMALPAMCGQCRSASADTACAEKHGARDEHRDHTRLVSANCEACADLPGVYARLVGSLPSNRSELAHCDLAHVGSAAAIVVAQDGFRDTAPDELAAVANTPALSASRSSSDNSACGYLSFAGFSMQRPLSILKL